MILPARNVAQFIPDMFTALQRNIDPDFELVFVDDGSADATSRLIAEASETLPLRVVRHDSPRGVSASRNHGMDLATGRYVTFLDPDDWFADGYLHRLVESIVDLDCDFVRVDHVQVHGRERIPVRAPEARRGVVLEPRSSIFPVHRPSMVDYPYSWAGIYKREILPLLRFPEGLHTAEDRPWVWQLHRKTESYAVVSLAGVFYRRLVSNSLTQISDDRQLHFLDAFAMVLDQVRDEPDVRTKAIRQSFSVIVHQIQSSARFTLAQRRTLRRGARALLATLPAEDLVMALPADHRRELLRPLLPPEARRLDVAG